MLYNRNVPFLLFIQEKKADWLYKLNEFQQIEIQEASVPLL